MRVYGGRYDMDMHNNCRQMYLLKYKYFSQHLLEPKLFKIPPEQN